MLDCFPHALLPLLCVIAEMMMYLDGRRHYQALIGEKFYGQSDTEADAHSGM